MAEPHLPLLAQIETQIRATGPMSVATFMGLCLTHPRQGYYAVGRPLGQAGDFVTAPEITQMFGELIGFFLVDLWQQMGEPAPVTLLELGPGRGTLMADALRAATRAPGFSEALRLTFFETNQNLRAEQARRLQAFGPRWLDDITELDEAPLLVVANEFFDALPIRQFVRADDGWHERQIGLRDGALAFGLSPTPIARDAAPPEAHDAHFGEVLEIGSAATDLIHRLGAKIALQGGALLALDYGYGQTQTGETLQAVKNHAYADPLAAPGDTDLSAHVNFSALAAAARAAGLVAAPLAEQGEFLLRLGLGQRAKALARANPHEAEASPAPSSG